MKEASKGDLVCEVLQEPDGGYVTECLTESIVTQGDTWEELRVNVLDAVEAFCFDGPKSQWMRLYLIRDKVLATR